MAIVDHASAFSHSNAVVVALQLTLPNPWKHVQRRLFIAEDISTLGTPKHSLGPRSDLCFKKNQVRLFEGSLFWGAPLLRSLCATQAASVSHMHWPCMSCILSKTTGNHIKVSAVRNKTGILGVPPGPKLALNLETATVSSLFKNCQNWQSLRTSCAVNFIEFHWYRIFKLLWTLTPLASCRPLGVGTVAAREDLRSGGADGSPAAALSALSAVAARETSGLALIFPKVCSKLPGRFRNNALAINLGYWWIFVGHTVR